jgi:hypothetical protein
MVPDPHPDPHRFDNLDPHQLAEAKMYCMWNMSLFEHFFMGLSLYFGS